MNSFMAWARQNKYVAAIIAIATVAAVVAGVISANNANQRSHDEAVAQVAQNSQRTNSDEPTQAPSEDAPSEQTSTDESTPTDSPTTGAVEFNMDSPYFLPGTQHPAWHGLIVPAIAALENMDFHKAGIYTDYAKVDLSGEGCAYGQACWVQFTQMPKDDRSGSEIVTPQGVDPTNDVHKRCRHVREDMPEIKTDNGTWVGFHLRPLDCGAEVPEFTYTYYWNDTTRWMMEARRAEDWQSPNYAEIVGQYVMANAKYTTDDDPEDS